MCVNRCEDAFYMQRRRRRTPCPVKIKERKMRNLFFAALAALSLGAAVAPAYAASVTDAGSATRMQQTGAYGRE